MHSILFRLKSAYPCLYEPFVEIFQQPVNELGQHVRVLTNECQDAGPHRVIFDGTQMTSGTCFFRLRFGAENGTRKLLKME